ncbi:MAG: hypothetical protein PVI43_00525 [Candidatus Bathyarchaeota archaeon]|jgi:hypothetical protein
MPDKAIASPDPEFYDQIIYALRRQLTRLDELADQLHDARDYAAEFPYEDARRMEEAIGIVELVKGTVVGGK